MDVVSHRAPSKLDVAVSPWVIATLAVASLWVHPIAIAAGFAVVSAAALRECLRDERGRWPLRMVYACIPLQYALVATGSYGLITLTLPLVAALAFPLVSVCAGDIRALAERSAYRYWCAMVAVYALSHAPALLMLDVPGRRGALLVFLVALALAGGA